MVPPSLPALVTAIEPLGEELCRGALGTENPPKAQPQFSSYRWGKSVVLGTPSFPCPQLKTNSSVFSKIKPQVALLIPCPPNKIKTKTFLLVLLCGLNELKHVKRLAQGQTSSSHSGDVSYCHCYIYLQFDLMKLLHYYSKKAGVVFIVSCNPSARDCS